MERQSERDVAIATIENTVRNGSERPLPGKGARGGTFRRFEKRHDSRMIVVIAELVGNDCYLITTYEDQPDTSRN
jgi:hypothetical protein